MSDLIYHDAEQGSEEWVNLRRGVITGSRFKERGFVNKELIIQMAREAGGLPDPMVFIGAYERFFQLATEWEREQCAKVCDDFERAKWESVKNISQNGGRLAFAGPMHCAAAIRARGETK